jgi:dolichyl-phosphate beta-glucosyltransferase
LSEDKFEESVIPENLEILFVNDGSTDQTQSILDRIKNSKVDSLHLNKNIGKGNAIFEGYQKLKEKLSDDDSICYIDADLSISLEEIYRLIQMSTSNKAVYGIRKLGDNNTISRHPLRHFLGRLIAFVIRVFTSVKIYDTQCGAKVLPFKYAQIAFESHFKTRWLFDIEIIKRIGEENIQEIPVNWSHVKGSKIGIRTIPRILYELITLKIIN